MKKGFTLIELLIVIAIIGILAVAFLPSIMGAPAKSRDAARIADVADISEKIVAKDLAGTPVTAAGCLAGGRTGQAPVPIAPAGLLASDFERGFPQDPKLDSIPNTGVATCTGAYYVYYDADGVIGGGPATSYRYFVVAKVEDAAKGNLANCGPIDLNVAAPTFTSSGLCYGVGVK